MIPLFHHPIMGELHGFSCLVVSGLMVLSGVSRESAGDLVELLAAPVSDAMMGLISSRPSFLIRRL